MGWGSIVGGLAGGLFGDSRDSRGRRAVEAYNAAQQQKALEFQAQMRDAELGELTRSQQDLAALGQRLATQNMAMATPAAMDRGMSGSVAMRGQRAAIADATFQTQQMGYEYGKARADVYRNQEYPMILREMPESSTGDFAKLGSMIGGGFFDGDDD